MASLKNLFIPDAHLEGTPDELRRARLTGVFALAMFVNSVPNVAVLFSHRVWTVGAAVAGCTVLYPTVPFVLKYTRSRVIAGTWLLFLIWAANLFASFFSGGLATPGLVWWGPSLIFAVMLLGNRAGLFWTAMLVAQTLGLFVLHKNGIEMRDDLVGLDRAEALWSAAATAFVAYYLLARVYENLKNQMLDEIATSKQAVERAHASARTVLDNVAQGLLIARTDGRMEPERSNAVNQWFGEAASEETVFDYLGRVDSRFGKWLRIGWDEISADYLPLELVLDQLPKRFTQAERRFDVSYRPIVTDGKVASVLLVITDVTELVAAERAEEAQRELLSVLQRVMVDRGIFLEFMEESRRRIQGLMTPGQGQTFEMRELHTIKGNAGIFGLSATARLCHELESSLVDEHRELVADERRALVDHWQDVEQRIRPILGDTAGQIELSHEEYQDALRAVAMRESYPELGSRMHAWAHEPTQKRLLMFAEQVRALSKRLDKGDLTVRIDDGGLRLPRACLAEFWSNLTHVLRNAIDHGIEDPEERLACGKTEHGEIVLSTRSERGEVIIEVADDGRGIDWNRVATRAKNLGIAAETAEDLEAALFLDGFSTKIEVTETSGRGVGLSAVRNVVTSLGGKIRIRSAAGQGTSFLISIPYARLRPSHYPGTYAAA